MGAGGFLERAVAVTSGAPVWPRHGWALRLIEQIISCALSRR